MNTPPLGHGPDEALNLICRRYTIDNLRRLNVHLVAHGSSGALLRQFLNYEACSHQVGAEATVLLRDTQPVKSISLEGLQGFMGISRLPVGLFGPWRELTLGKFSGPILPVLLLFCERKVTHDWSPVWMCRNIMLDRASMIQLMSGGLA